MINIVTSPQSVKLHGLRPMKAMWQLFWALVVLVLTAVVLPWIEHSGSSSINGATTRLLVFAGGLFSNFLMLIAVGVGITGKRTGVLWSSRNTYSLSRLQIVLWTWLVLSALEAVVVCRAWNLFDLGNAHGAGLSEALNIYIPPELLTVMGISAATSAAAPAILSIKSQSSPPPQAALDAATARTGVKLQAVGKIYVRPEQSPPLALDLFKSDDVSAAGTVDISKVQQFAVTVLLWCVYFTMLLHLMCTGVAEGALPAGEPTGTTVLPPLSQTFVYLLGISHAGYLAYKSVPAVALTGETNLKTDLPTPPSTLLPRPLPPKV